jgi:Fe-S cluster assembly ATP-binding protein
MLEIKNLTATIEGKEVLRGVDLIVPDGEIHAIMGPNGAGKSTLSYVLSGREGYEVTGGTALYNGQDILALPPEARAAAGIFLAFQYPVELPGVGNANFIRTALNAVRRARGEPELDAVAFLKAARAEIKKLSMADDMLKRNVNVGFSGGEKKRNEVLQMALLRPGLAILDETDSGLDIDALKIVADGVNALRGPKFSALIITHYQRLLDHIVPDRVHVLSAGRIERSGGPELALELEAHGYARPAQEAAA